MSSHSGQVSFPGGKKDEEDEDIIKTALRWGTRFVKELGVGYIFYNAGKQKRSSE